MAKLYWESPDGKIKKEIIKEGKWDDKPYESSECLISIEDCPEELKKFDNTTVVSGDFDGDLGRNFDICLTTMHEGETAKFIIKLEEESVSFTLKLLKLKYNGVIFEWDAKTKHDLAVKHKNKGVQLFNNNQVRDAAYRFTRGLKIILSIPLDVQDCPSVVDGVPLSEINSLKANLYNNMASCYLKNENWEMVIEFCTKTLNLDNDNVKALYKIGVAYRHDKNFEKAEKSFLRVLELEPGHSAAKAHLHYVQVKLKEASIRCNSMVKKMFGGALESSESCSTDIEMKCAVETSESKNIRGDGQ